jgi:hypothetical protein
MGLKKKSIRQLMTLTNPKFKNQSSRKSPQLKRFVLMKKNIIQAMAEFMSINLKLKRLPTMRIQDINNSKSRRIWFLDNASTFTRSRLLRSTQMLLSYLELMYPLMIKHISRKWRKLTILLIVRNRQNLWAQPALQLLSAIWKKWKLKM